MKKRHTTLILQGISLGFIFISVMITGFMLIRYSQMRSSFPLDLTIADVPVGGLNAGEAASRLTQAYGIPIEMIYANSQIQVSPSAIGFSLNLETMLAAADLQRTTRSFWPGFWDYLWNTSTKPKPVPLSATIVEERIRDYLVNEIVPRYDIPSKPPVPIQGTAGFSQGEAGRSLNIDESVLQLKNALRSATDRVVTLTFERTSPVRASSMSLTYMIRQILQQNEYDGIAEFYLLDLSTREEISVAFSNLESVPTNISFTAASTIKIPIMIYTYANRNLPLSETLQSDMELMIEISENGPADDLLQTISGTLAPISFTEDLQRLGYKNTFLGGLFYNGAPLLQRYSTPANERTDVTTNPDVYNQTTPADIGMMLDDLFLCANYNGGGLKAVYQENITQEECTTMLDLLSKNKTAVLLEAGIPETTKVAHKHGWILEADGLIHNISDAGIIYSPNATYIFAMYFYNKNQLVFDPINAMASQISNAVYQYYNQSAN